MPGCAGLHCRRSTAPLPHTWLNPPPPPSPPPLPACLVPQAPAPGEGQLLSSEAAQGDYSFVVDPPPLLHARQRQHNAVYHAPLLLWRGQQGGSRWDVAPCYGVRRPRQRQVLRPHRIHRLLAPLLLALLLPTPVLLALLLLACRLPAGCAHACGRRCCSKAPDKLGPRRRRRRQQVQQQQGHTPQGAAVDQVRQLQGAQQLEGRLSRDAGLRAHTGRRANQRFSGRMKGREPCAMRASTRAVPGSWRLPVSRRRTPQGKQPSCCTEFPSCSRRSALRRLHRTPSP